MFMKNLLTKIGCVIVVLGLTEATVVFSAHASPPFASPQEASEALENSLKRGDVKELRNVLGVPSKESLMSGDAVADKNNLQGFYENFREQIKWETSNDNRATLYVGSEEWPFPFPLQRGANGWYFDFKSGKEEMLNRRIGKNELAAIALCREFVKAQEEYFSRDPDGDGYHEYAQALLSSPGFRNGLFWARRPGERPSPFGAQMAQAVAEGYISTPGKSPSPYHGYYYRVLKEQGSSAPAGAKKYITREGLMSEGFALIAYPTRWGYSGIMSFLVGKDGVLYERDLGSKSAELGSKINSYNPTSEWKKIGVDEPS